MDNVYRSFGAGATKKVNIKDYFDRYSRLLKPNEEDSCQAGSSTRMNFDEEQMQRLSEICSVDNLIYPGEEDAKDEIRKKRKDNPDLPPIVPNNTGLETLKNLSERYSDYDTKRIPLKYLSEQPIHHNEVPSSNSTTVPGQDILMFVRVYNPFVCELNNGTRARRRITLSRVISILGHQTLAQLRDKISCMSDLSVSFEASENPSVAETLISNKEKYKSGFFYIENTFYNDMREATNKDNSAVIRKWAESRNLGPFQVANMEDTRMDSLNVRFCYPWLYQHQGSCEHLIVFSDARLINCKDHLDVANYPRIHRVRCLRSNKCMLCGVRPVYWLTIDSDRVPHNPCYFCKPCFESFNYLNGEKMGNFKAYRFPYDAELIESFRKSTVKMEPMEED